MIVVEAPVLHLDGGLFHSGLHRFGGPRRGEISNCANAADPA
jgi:hypothetical protein